jgi:hypothetical protein
LLHFETPRPGAMNSCKRRTHARTYSGGGEIL